MAATQPVKPLVFLSASGRDGQYRNGLRERLDYFREIECWDKSQLRASENWADQRNEAVERASLAVIFLSPSYLESPETKLEINILGDHAKKRALTLFPILIEDCEWKRYPFLREPHIWGLTKPLSKLGESTLILEYLRLAAAIRGTVSGRPASEANTSVENAFSDSAEKIISAAGSLALQTKRDRITASCLLFALSGESSISSPSLTSTFCAAQLEAKGLYETEFEKFQKDGGPNDEIVVTLPGTPWKMTRNASGVITRAAVIAANVSYGHSSVVHARHLFAALITPLAEGSPSVRSRLKRMGVEEPQLRANFREFIYKYAPTENGAAWDNALGTSPDLRAQTATDGEPQTVSPLSELTFRSTYSAFIPDRASYRPKVPGELLDDSLNVRTYASHLAQVIAAKDTAMPLSIGLFGAWGAGKSHFIDLLDEQLSELKKQPGNAFHKNIVPIRFNAWHYLDTNLWASLVSEIFDQLFTSLESPEEKEQAKLENLKKQLADQSALAAEAKAAVTKAQNVRIEAENELRAAVQARIEQENTVHGFLNDLTKLDLTDQLQAQLNEVADDLGFPKLKSSFKELEARADEVRSLTGRIKALWLALFTRPGWGWRAVLFIVALFSPLIVSGFALLLAQAETPWVKELLAGATRTIAQVATLIAALSTWLATQIKAGNSLVNKLEDAYDQVEEVRAEREAKDERTIKAQAALAQKKQTEEEARHKLHEAEEKLKTIKTELAELAPGRQLMRFLRERATGEDYRRHLGLVSLVRQDFKQLSDLMTAPKTETKPDASPKPDAPAKPDAAAKSEVSPAANATPNGDGLPAASATPNADGSAAANASPKAPPPELPNIDRIILYIDDLDRCRAERVIEVLEAVHLLLAFPLFAVVVAVDPRWLRQSLLDHYPRLLGGADADGANARTRSLGRPATPQDYLEKIFQVPFNLQPMEKTGYESLVDHLFSSNGSKPPQSPPTFQAPPPENIQLRTEVRQTETATEVVTTPVSIPSIFETRPPLAEKQPLPPPPPDPERLVLTGKEIADVKKFQLLFQTPRAVKRLANTYSLIRVGVSQSEWSKYLGTESSGPDYRVPLLLLAVTSAFPALARPWLLWLRTTPPTHWQIDDTELQKLIENNTDTTASVEWQKLQHCLRAIDLDGWPPPDSETLNQWVPRVARYSF